MTIRNIQCPKCKANRGMTIYEDGSICFACGFKEKTKSLIKEDKADRSSFKGFDWDNHRSPEIDQYLASIGINKELADFYCIGSKGFDRLVIPYYNDYMLKSIYAKYIIGEGQPKHLWKGEKVHLKSYESPPKEVVLVEDVFSWIRVSLHMPCICTRGCTPRLKDFNLDELEQVERLIIWYDNDKAGIEGARKVAKALSLDNINIEILNSGKDPKEHSDEEIIGALYEN